MVNDPLTPPLSVDEISKSPHSPIPSTERMDCGDTDTATMGMKSIDNNMASSTDKVAILDAGAQYGKVIDRRVRELNVESVLLPLNTSAEAIKAQAFRAIIISGGPSSVNDADCIPFDSRVFALGIPVLGICYGFQLIHKHFGGAVEKLVNREDGTHLINVDSSCRLFSGLDTEQHVLLTHGDSIRSICGGGFKVVARSGPLIAAVANEDLRIYGVQFHPEVDLTTNGRQMLHNFLLEISGCSQTYTVENRELRMIQEIRDTVPPGHKTLVMVSGGVDSTVCAALLHRALSADQVVAVHIDNGFMRKDESDHVMLALTKLGLKPHVYKGKMAFLTSHSHVTDSKTGKMMDTPKLCHVIDPEIKRLIVGETFMKAKDEMLSQLNLDQSKILLAQGTLRPDLIESASSLASSHADTIKTHHNDTPGVRELRAQGKVIEPLKDFHKDEVRRLGRALDLPADIVDRHPFPGPGLAIRILCCTEAYKPQDFRMSGAFLSAMLEFGRSKNEDTAVAHINKSLGSHAQDFERLRQLTNEHSVQVHGVLLPIRTVGVQGDSRSYSYVVALSCSQRPPPWDILMFLARVIPNVIRTVNRVVYIFGEPVKQTIDDVTPTLLCETTIEQAQEADYWATKVLHESGEAHKVQQMPVVLVPVDFDRESQSAPSVRRSVCLRPFVTNDFMTGRPAEPNMDLSEKVLFEMVNSIQENVLMISRVMYDLTTKPPGTTEWE